jgi:outer membrane protein assembly factor BamE (lipoprotein component of BamABCDE complex)
MRWVRFIGSIAMSIGLLWISGCTSSSFGNQNLTQDNVSKITKGVTTRDEVVKLLGEPDNVSLLPDGRRMMMYQGMQNNSNQTGRIMQYVVPFAALVPTSETNTMHRQSLQIYVGKDNVVQDFEFADNTSQTKTTASAFGAHTEQTTPTASPNP